ncbi:thiamine pyrophosphate-binding protein [Aurantimonas sp. MSK8Z-1]|uniref:thiamine pyrophosphate-binding protein n=1 Tax=Mangrovibrevibacter kandeliae TaxID=2968473 RepID=UPI002118FE90|nr:thiamine pyrophosphate-binding protein [Aurantimonas sp. MSK8Z-1]MCW4115751.1 thiamine pyrophosphate-binding protein [Aurantimonas sp. MSK8Z-1]
MTIQDRGLSGGGDASRLIERPIEHHDAQLFGSDVVADTLRALDIPYIALNPGASFRGFHDSLVNHLGNEEPQMLLCLHEEHAVAIAQGWAKVTGKAMAVAVHSNVGLFHATMAIFNAWCDRMPMVVFGATGPVDAMHRRPWIDWIHTARDQGAIVRNYVKWDDQPASPGAAREALARAKWIAETIPQGPTYVNLDAGMQEAPLSEPLPDIQLDRLMPHVDYAPGAGAVADLARRLKSARRPVILVGRVSRSEAGWAQRIALAEATGARVLTDLKIGAGFPTDHPLSLAPPGVFPLPQAQAALDEADLVLSLDWVVLQGVLPAAKRPGAQIVHVSLDHHIHNGWSMDHQALTPVDAYIAADPDALVAELCREMDLAPSGTYRAAPQPEIAVPADPQAPLGVPDLARQLKRAVGDRAMSLLHLPLSWDGAFWPFRHPLDFLGSDGGGGIGGGPGISVGAALALRGMGRLPIAICGDGDFLMGVTALWTAVHYRIPLLVVVANNRSFYNDEVHQERVARMRGRPVENKWIGQKMADPEIDLAAMARAQGAVAFGPVRDRAAMDAAFAEAIRAVEQGGVAVVDVRVEPGYTPAMAGALTRESGSKA